MSDEVRATKVNRREFLNIAWLASLGFLFVDIVGVTYLFAIPIAREGEFGGDFTLGKAGDIFPRPGKDPIPVSKGKMWLVRLEDSSILALYKVCTHLGCLYNWHEQGNRFSCPCHGSQFELDGTFIRGPAPRSLDRFVIRLFGPDSNEVAATDEQGNPLSISNEDLLVVVETGNLILGKPQGT